MLRIIFTKNPIVRDTCVSVLALARNPTEISPDFLIYQKWDWILVYSREMDIDIILPTILENWDPDRIYLPYIGRSIDMTHEIGDVILPNVFMSYDEQVALIDPDSDRVHIPKINAKFLEIYTQQNDYYVEDFWLSIGGIVTDRVPRSDRINTALMMTYEADIYIEESLDASYEVTRGDDIPALILCGIVEGKKWKNESGTPEQIAVRNIISTIRLTEDDTEN